MLLSPQKITPKNTFHFPWQRSLRPPQSPTHFLSWLAFPFLKEPYEPKTLQKCKYICFYLDPQVVDIASCFAGLDLFWLGFLTPPHVNSPFCDFLSSLSITYKTVDMSPRYISFGISWLPPPLPTLSPSPQLFYGWDDPPKGNILLCWSPSWPWSWTAHLVFFPQCPFVRILPLGFTFFFIIRWPLPPRCQSTFHSTPTPPPPPLTSLYPLCLPS